MSERKRMARATVGTSRVTRGDVQTTAGETDVTPRADLSTCLERARVRLGVQVKEIAYWWQIDPGYVSRVLSNVVPLPDYRLAELPRELQRATLEEWARDLDMVTGRKADLTRAIESLVRLATDEAGSAWLWPFDQIVEISR